MAKKKYRAKRKYSMGGRIPKYANGTNNVEPLSALQIQNPYSQGIPYQQSINPTIDTYNTLTDRYNTVAPEYRWTQEGHVAKRYPSGMGYGFQGDIPELNADKVATTSNSTSGQQWDSFMENSNTYGAIAQGAGQVGSGISESINPNNTQYGYQTSSAASTAGSTGVGSVIGGVAELAGSAAESLGAVDYNEYGVNQSGDISGALYSNTAATIDPFSQLEKDINEEDWWSAAGTLIGGQFLTGTKQYYDEQDVAEERESEAKKLKRQRKMSLKGQTPEPYYKPTVMYQRGGTVQDPNREIVGTYGELNKKWSDNPIYQPGPVQEYKEPTYIKYNRGTGKGILDSTEFTSDSTAGPQVRRYRIFKDTSTGTDYQVPIFDEDVFNQYFPEAKYPDGGMVRNPNAELEEDEVYRLPNGQIKDVPEDTPGHDKGGIEMSLPEGTQILGKMKGKYNGESYKDIGGRLEKKYNKYEKILADPKQTKLSKATAKRMLDKVQAEFSKIMQEQEVQKNLQGPKGSTEAESQAPQMQFAKGGQVPKFQEGGEVLEWMRSTEPNPKLASDFVKHLKSNPDYYGGNNVSTDLDSVMSYWNQVYSGKNDWVGDPNKPEQWATGPALHRYATDPKTNKTISGYQGPDYSDDRDYAAMYNAERANMDKILSDSSNNEEISVKDEGKGRRGFNWNIGGDATGTLGTAAQLAPAAYNMYQGIFGSPEELDASDYTNPYTGRILRNLEDRKYNIRPELEANELAYQTARRNTRQVAPGVGNLLSNYGALSGARMRSDASAYARKQNMENQWRGQDAQILAGLGGQEAATRLRVDDYNQAAKAAQQGALSTGLDQLAGSAANMLSERNMKSRDAGLYSALDTYLQSFDLGDLTSGQYSALQKAIEKYEKKNTN